MKPRFRKVVAQASLSTEELERLEAVRSVLELQRVLAARNADLTPERRMEFRMGIHLGEVRVQDGRLFGTDVNVAARLEGLAEPGGVCISAAVHSQLSGKLDVECEDLGEHSVRLISLAPFQKARPEFAARQRRVPVEWSPSHGQDLVGVAQYRLRLFQKISLFPQISLAKHRA